MNYVFLPNPNLLFVRGDGVLSAEAYRALKGLQSNLQDQIDTLAEIVAQVQALNADVTALDQSKADKDLLVLGSGSVERIGGTDLSTPVVFQLVNDSSFPGPNLTYGTDPSGVKGWMPFGSANIASLPGATYTSLQQFVNTMHSPGTITGGEISDLGGGNIRVAAGTGMIRVADDDVSLLPFFNFAQTDFVVPADQLTRFFGVVYNGGSPVVEMRTVFDWDKDTEIPLGSCVRFNGTTVTLTNPYRTGDPITNIIQRFDAIGPAQRDNSVGGLTIGETGTRNVTVSAGRIWSRLTDHTVSAKNSSVDGMVTGYFNGTGLTLTTGVTQWDNLHYNNTGTGTLDVLDNNKYANLWFFISTEGDQYGFIYGTAQYNNLAAASVEGIPSFLTENFFAQTLILGRFIFQKGAATASSIESAFTRVFTTQPVTNHNDLSGLQGGQLSEYYHLTAAQHTKIAQIGNLADPGADNILYWNDTTNQYAYTPVSADAKLLLADTTVPRLGTANTWSLTQTFSLSPIISTGATNALFVLDANAGTARRMVVREGGVNRWQIGSDGSSNFILQVHDSGGGLVGNVFSIPMGTQTLAFTVGFTTPSAVITGGTINNTVIGGTTPVAGTFTTILGRKPWAFVTAATGANTPNLNNNDATIRTALSGSLTINNPTGTKVNGQPYSFRLRDNGTARAINWGSEYRAMTTALPTTTVANKTLYVIFEANADENTMDLMIVTQQP